jgi:thymidylate synthase ThyX
MAEFYNEQFPKDPDDSDFVYRQAIRAKAFDAVRGVLPAASLSNVGIYGTGQGYEALLLRMRSHPLPESRAYADLMLGELRKVIPSFLKRVDLDDRGVAWSTYLASTRSAMEEIAEQLFPAGSVPEDDPGVRLVDFDPDGEVKVVAAALYPHTHVGEAQVEARVRQMGAEERLSILKAYVGERANRRHKPGRAFERTAYRFDVLADYGAFRDLQRHRMLSIEWQALSPRHGFTRPEAVDLAGTADRFDEAMERSASLHDALAERFPAQAGYAVSLAYKVRFYLHLNAREAMHLLELRTTPQGHPAYRVVGQEMHRLIAEQAGHPALAEAMRFVDHAPEPSLERLDAERRAEARRQSR